jgi:glycosyltransferase involved in cell wall biosynthesis
MNEKINILLIGYLPPPIGGVTVLFKQLLDDIKKNDSKYKFDIIDISHNNTSIFNKFISYLSLLVILPFKIKNNELITFHATSSSAFKLGPILYLYCKILKKKLIIRKFGGTFDKNFKQKNFVIKWIVKNTIFKADLWLFETKNLIKYFKDKIKNVEWYPNSRKLQKKNYINKRKKAQKFVFISQVKKEKGVYKIFEASKNLPSDIDIDLYGPLEHNISEKEINDLENKYNANYKGVLEPKNVMEKLKCYDVLLLPTFHEGEGYPGIILEAYSCGIPVITTDWNSINEIVTNKSGILIEPKNTKQLKEAILKLYNDKKYFQILSKGAYEQGRFFDSLKWSKKFIVHCNDLIERDKNGTRK